MDDEKQIGPNVDDDDIKGYEEYLKHYYDEMRQIDEDNEAENNDKEL